MKKSKVALWRRSLIASIVATVAGYCALLCIAIWFDIRAGMPVLPWDAVPARIASVFFLACQWLSLLMLMLVVVSLYYGQKLSLYACLILGVVCPLVQYAYTRYGTHDYDNGFWQSMSAGIVFSLLPHLAACLAYATGFWLQWKLDRARCDRQNAATTDKMLCMQFTLDGK